jgi:hypothetical protein
MAEAQTRWVMSAIEHMEAEDVGAIEVTPAAQAAWNDAIQARMRGTVWLEGGCSSWYLDANGLNTSLWPDFSFRFAREMRRFDPAELVCSRVRDGEPVVA